MTGSAKMWIFMGIIMTGTLFRPVVGQQNTFGPGWRFLCHCAGEEPCDENNGSCSYGCADGWMGPGCQYRVIDGAMFRQFDESSSAERAMDGNKTTCSQTTSGGHSNGPRWWRVKFKGQEVVYGLEITTMGQHLSSFQGFKVYVEDSSDITKKPRNKTLCYEHPVDSANHSMIKVTCREPMQGNQLTIELNKTSDALVLCEVKIPGGRNVAFKATTDSSRHHHIAGPKYAVDGNTSQYSWYKCCYLLSATYTWFEVDLGRPFSIFLVTIHFFETIEDRDWRLDARFSVNDTWNSLYTWSGDSSYMEYRSQFEACGIRMVNTKKKVSWINDAICEIQVFGDCPDNKCGLDCEDACHCKRHSIYSKYSGVCDSSGCQDGWHGSVNGKCDKECDGEMCRHHCSGHCKDGSDCRKTDGHCAGGCSPGWQGLKCDQECDFGRYGEMCNQQCSKHCEYSSDCRKTDGHCAEGCSPGWHGPKCDQECDAGWYGGNCNERCSGHCKIGTSCDKVDGHCPLRCDPGWQGEKCDQKCTEFTWGEDCNETCGNCLDALPCHHDTGRCREGLCKSGFEMPFCKECDSGLYGERCNQHCSGYCIDGSFCRKNDGYCAEGCSPGWHGLQCDQRCDDGRFGEWCTQDCSGHCVDGSHCRKTDGHCAEGCIPGWHGPKCDQERSFSTTVLVVAISVNVITISVVVVVAIAIYRRKTRPQLNSTVSPGTSQNTTGDTDPGVSQENGPNHTDLMPDRHDEINV